MKKWAITRGAHDPPVGHSGGAMTPGAERALALLQGRYGSPPSGLVILVIDRSGSMGTAEKLGQARSGCVDFARKAVERRYEVGLVAFDETAERLQEPTTDLDAIARAAHSVSAGGSTDMAQALRMAAELIDDRRPLRSIVIATDCHPDSKEETLAVADRIKARGIQIIVIPTADADLDFMRQLASHATLVRVAPLGGLEKEIGNAADLLRLPASTGR